MGTTGYHKTSKKLPFFEFFLSLFHLKMRIKALILFFPFAIFLAETASLMAAMKEACAILAAQKNTCKEERSRMHTSVKKLRTPAQK